MLEVYPRRLSETAGFRIIRLKGVFNPTYVYTAHINICTCTAPKLTEYLSRTEHLTRLPGAQIVKYIKLLHCQATGVEKVLCDGICDRCKTIYWINCCSGGKHDHSKCLAEADFLDQLVSTPDDWELRLVFSDWLEDQKRDVESRYQRHLAEEYKHGRKNYHCTAVDYRDADFSRLGIP